MYKIVVVGGGTAGWLTALSMNKFMPYSEVIVIASSELGILGAGEGTTPHFMDLLKDLDIPESALFEHAKATVKNGINFTNWNGDGKDYYHPFWEGQYALHFDANLLAKYLQTVGLERGIKLVDDIVTDINEDKNGYIKSLTLKSGDQIETDFVMDCSGLRRLIIGNHYKSTWNSYTKHLPAKRAMPFFIDHDDKDLPDYTGAIAMKAGWVWKIPVQGRYGCGYVFDSNFITDEQAKAEVEEMLGHEVTIPRFFNFEAGSYDKTWIKNCIAIGLSAGFTEPMEATSIWIQVKSLQLLKEYMRTRIRDGETVIENYNNIVRNFNNDLMIFIHLHYLTKRDDSEFWTTFKERNQTPEFILRLRDMNKDTMTNQDLDKLHLANPEKTEDYMKSYYINSWLTVAEGVGFFG